MNTLYITEPYTVVRLSSRTLILTKGKEKLAQVPLIRLDNILVYGNAQITTQAMAALLEDGIEVSYLSPTGKLRGRLISGYSKNVIIRLAQYEKYLDQEFTVNVARTIIKAKLRNGRKLIRRFSSNHRDIDMAKELTTITFMLKKLDKQTTIPSMMGSEGVATAAYFRAFGKMFLREFTFKSRTRRPPKDPVNALLSFGYTLLTNELLALIIAHGLDPYIGFLHGVTYGRPSLALDLVEEFRHPIIDRFVLRLINREILKKSDFDITENSVLLTDDGRRTFFRHYDRLLKKTIGQSEVELNLRDILKRQVRRMSASLKQGNPYEPYSFKA